MRLLLTSTVAAIVAFGTVGCEIFLSDGYSLPVRVGQSVGDVDLLLGNPTETVGFRAGEVTSHPDRDSNHRRLYYEHGLFCEFENGKLSSIVVHSHCDYRGFKIFRGKVTRGVSTADTRKSVLGRLGRPDDTDSEAIAATVDRDVPVTFPSSTVYTWHSRGYDLRICFLDQAQQVDSVLTFPKDHIDWIEIASR
jgi:hypothetical protein